MDRDTSYLPSLGVTVKCHIPDKGPRFEVRFPEAEYSSSPKLSPGDSSPPGNDCYVHAPVCPWDAGGPALNPSTFLHVWTPLSPPSPPPLPSARTWCVFPR